MTASEVTTWKTAIGTPAFEEFELEPSAGSGRRALSSTLEDNRESKSAATEESESEDRSNYRILKGLPSLRWDSKFLSSIQKSLAMLPTFCVILLMARGQIPVARASRCSNMYLFVPVCRWLTLYLRGSLLRLGVYCVIENCACNIALYAPDQNTHTHVTLAMGFLPKFFSLRSRKSKKEKGVTHDLPPDLQYREDDQEETVSRLLRSSSTRFAVMKEVDYATLPPLREFLFETMYVWPDADDRSASNPPCLLHSVCFQIYFVSHKLFTTWDVYCQSFTSYDTFSYRIPQRKPR